MLLRIARHRNRRALHNLTKTCHRAAAGNCGTTAATNLDKQQRERFNSAELELIRALGGKQGRKAISATAPRPVADGAKLSGATSADFLDNRSRLADEPFNTSWMSLMDEAQRHLRKALLDAALVLETADKKETGSTPRSLAVLALGRSCVECTEARGTEG